MFPSHCLLKRIKNTNLVLDRIVFALNGNITTIILSTANVIVILQKDKKHVHLYCTSGQKIKVTILYLEDVYLMLPAHFHDVTYNQIWSKILQELIKNPARNTRTIFED